MFRELFKYAMIAGGIILIMNFLSNLKFPHSPLSRKEFREYKHEFAQKLDSLDLNLKYANAQLDTLRIDVDSLKRNTDSILSNNQLIYYSLDSIKKGQIIIYREVRKREDKSLFEKIKLLLK